MKTSREIYALLLQLKVGKCHRGCEEASGSHNVTNELVVLKTDK